MRSTRPRRSLPRGVRFRAVPRSGGKARSILPSSESDRLVIARLEFEVPHDVCLYGFTKAHPEIRVKVLNTAPLPGGLTLGEYDLVGSAGEDVRTELRAYPDVVSVERFTEIGEPDRYQVTLRPPSYLQIASHLRVLLRYPRTVQGGIFRCETVAHVSQVRELLAELRKVSPRVRLVSLRSDRLESVHPLFTPVQRNLFRRAVGSGYYDVPRKVTLETLARKVSRSKSSVSEILATVEKKLVEAAAATNE